MAYNGFDDDEIDCEIIETYGIFSQGIKSWNKEVNLVSWNGRPAKLDIRAWQKDHTKCGKGITLTRDEAEELVKLLAKILKAKHREKPQSRRQAKPQEKPHGRAGSKPAQPKPAPKPQRPLPPKTLQPFYTELKIPFGSGPDECKTARNTLLKKYHPDTHTGSIAFATRKTIKIKEAYDTVAGWWRENSS